MFFSIDVVLLIEWVLLFVLIVVGMVDCRCVKLIKEIWGF